MSTDQVKNTLQEEKGPIAETASVEVMEPVKVSFFRSTLWNTLVVGWASFLAPGIYNALASTGAGGLSDINIGNASTAIAYGLIVPSALMATAASRETYIIQNADKQVISKLGPRVALIIGSCGYAPFAASLYTNSAFRNQWFLILGAIVCGATSGLFWVSEGAIIMNYSEPGRKGRHVALWQSLFQSATIIGGAINLGLNINQSHAGGLSPRTYLVFVALTCTAPLVAFFVTPPKKVQRVDGLPVPAFPSEGFLTEIWLTLRELRDPRILASAFLWSQCLFIPSYFTTYLAIHFSVRARALGSLLAPIITIIVVQLVGLTLDNHRIQTRIRLVCTWAFLITLSLMSVIWLLIMNYRMDTVPAPVYDWSTPGFGVRFAPSIIGSAIAWALYGYNYYMASFVFPREADGIRLTRIIATLRSAESGAAAISFGINSIGLSLVQIGWINLVFVILVIFLGGYVLQYIWVEDRRGTFDEPHRHATISESSSSVA